MHCILWSQFEASVKTGRLYKCLAPNVLKLENILACQIAKGQAFDVDTNCYAAFKLDAVVERTKFRQKWTKSYV